MSKKYLRWISRFAMGILLFSFVVVVNFILFFSYVEKGSHAILVISGNVLALAVLFTCIDTIYREEMVLKPIKRIQDALEKVIIGDFSERIDYIKGPDSGNEFDEIITFINHMIEELSGVETLRTDFVANVSHELKTPLAVMQNYGTLLQTPDLSEEKRLEYAKAITEQTKRLSALVGNILKMNKLENQQIYPNIEKYDLCEQLCECMLEFESVWEEKNIEIETHLMDEVYVQADKELLSLVWNNLISNALKFTEEGGTVTLRLLADETYVYVEVKDTGCGMTPQTGQNIFKKFYQGDTSHATKGNGLGLALVKRVIDICKGEISVSSRIGEGSCFTVKLTRYVEEQVANID